MKLFSRFQNGLAEMRAMQSFRRPRKCKEVDPMLEATITADDSSVESDCLAASAPPAVKHQQQQAPEREPPAKGVRFSNKKKNGREKCFVRTIEKLTDPNLWWRAEETIEIQDGCIELVEQNRTGPNCMDGPTMRFIDHGWKESNRSREILFKMKEAPQVRGLERHIVHKYDQMMNEHIQNVLEIQKTTNNEYLLRLASRQSSQAWEELARVRARHDEAVVRRKSKKMTNL